MTISGSRVTCAPMYSAARHVGSRLSFLGLATISLALAAGCSAASPDDVASDDTAAAATEAATITFHEDGRVDTSGELKAGSKVKITYDTDRLPDCRGETNGRPAWTVSGFASLDGKEKVTFDAAKPFSLPLTTGGDLALWFQVSNRWGCSAWDSKKGANYHFNVTAPKDTGATITFSDDGKVSTTGELRVGSDVKVRFDQDRLPACRGSVGGGATWNITGYASINGGKPQTFQTTVAAGGVRKTDVDAKVKLPESGDLALWFEATNRDGCSEFDSRDGENHHFKIAE